MPVFRRAGAGAHATLPRTSSKKGFSCGTFTFREKKEMLLLLLLINVDSERCWFVDRKKKADWRARDFSLHTTTRHKTQLQNSSNSFYGALFQTHNSAFSAFFWEWVCVWFWFLFLFVHVSVLCFMLFFTFVVFVLILCVMVLEIDLFFLCFLLFFV